MANTTPTFHRTSLLNIGALLGLALGLAVGMLGAAALYPASPTGTKQPTNTSGRSQSARTTKSLALEQMRVSWVIEAAQVADALRTTTTQVDTVGTNQSLQRDRTHLQQSVQSLYGASQAGSFSQELSAMEEQLLAYARLLRTNEKNPTSALDGSDQHLSQLTTILGQVEKGIPSTLVSSRLKQYRDALRAVVQSTKAGNPPDAYLRQSQALDAIQGLMNLFGR